VKVPLHTSVPHTGNFDAEAGTQAYPYVPLRGTSEFRAALADEYRKTVQLQGDLAVLYLDVPGCSPEQVEEIGLLLCSLTETHKTVFLYSPTCFALLLRKMGKTEAALFSLKAFHQVQMNFPDVYIRLNIAAYPEIVTNLAEFEARAPKYAGSREHAERSVG
jgi:hypothetical protein